MNDDARDVLERSLEAHGGRARWEAASRLHVEVDIGGAALMLKGRSPFLRRVTLAMSVTRPEMELSFGGRSFQMRGHHVDEVDESGEVLRSCDVAVRNGKHRTPLLWSALHEAHFLGYALWNYGLGPWALLNHGKDATRLAPAKLRGSLHERVRVTYADGVPTHSPEQTFWFDGEGRLARLDYTAHSLAWWAFGGHEVLSYRDFDGLLMTERRRVWLRPLNGRTCARILPVMWGKILAASLQPASSEPG